MYKFRLNYWKSNLNRSSGKQRESFDCLKSTVSHSMSYLPPSDSASVIQVWPNLENIHCPIFSSPKLEAGLGAPNILSHFCVKPFLWLCSVWVSAILSLFDLSQYFCTTVFLPVIQIIILRFKCHLQALNHSGPYFRRACVLSPLDHHLVDWTSCFTCCAICGISPVAAFSNISSFSY